MPSQAANLKKCGPNESCGTPQQRWPRWRPLVVRRGEILWCGLEPRREHEQGEDRPVIVVSADAYNETRSPLVAIVPLTRALAKNPLHVALSVEETGLETPSTALIDHARFVDRSRLRPEVAGRLIPIAQARVDRNLARVFGLSPGAGVARAEIGEPPDTPSKRP
jgi:mRNA interferase MazF